MAQSAANLSLEPNITETIKTIDFSNILNRMDSYQKNACIYTQQFAFDDLKILIEFYPKGNKKTTDYSSLFLRIANCKKNDCRKLQFAVESRYNKSSLIKPIHTYIQGWGWNSWRTEQQLKQSPKVAFMLKLYHDPDFVVLKQSHTSFDRQLARMYALSKTHGDVTLVVKLEDCDSDSLYHPLAKKRRLGNSYECTVCNKSFQSNRALKSHQSKKKDQAHRNCKNNNNAGLDDEEFLISSMVLRSASKVFNRMLSTNMREQQEKRIEIQAKNVEDVEAFTYFMSTNVLINDCNPLNVIRLAHYYEMDRLLVACVNRIMRDLNIQNFAENLRVFDKLQIVDGYKSLVKFAKTNLEELKKAHDFESIPHSFKCLVFNQE